ncbi:MAG: heavy metal-binding domain-containing protein, partial [Pedobacter sp.]
SDYKKNGMFITESNSVNFNYEPVASVAAMQISGYLPSDKMQKTFTEDVYGSSSTASPVLSKKFLEASREQVLDELCKKAKQIGANGILNLQIKYIPATTESYSGYEASGMAIKK